MVAQGEGKGQEEKQIAGIADIARHRRDRNAKPYH
jgi:hypothetical protein